MPFLSQVFFNVSLLLAHGNFLPGLNPFPINVIKFFYNKTFKKILMRIFCTSSHVQYLGLYFRS